MEEFGIPKKIKRRVRRGEAMGLDMYLTREHYISREERKQPDMEKVQHIVYEEIYWRKANAIHNWFVANVQGGEDDCGKYEVSLGQLKELLATVDRVLNNPEEAPNLLPTVSGFFFGDTEYGHYYIEDLEYTQAELSKMLALGKITENGVWDTWYYRASW